MVKADQVRKSHTNRSIPTLSENSKNNLVLASVKKHQIPKKLNQKSISQSPARKTDTRSNSASPARSPVVNQQFKSPKSPLSQTPAKK